MKGYKGMNPDMTCRGFQYEIGKTYKMEGAVSLCNRGFHFCKKLADVFDYYNCDITVDNTERNRFFEIEASGEIINGRNKCVSSEITIVKELNYFEILRCAYGGGYGYGPENGYGYEYGDGCGCGFEYSDKYGYGFGDGYGCGHSDNGAFKVGFGDGYRYGYANGTGRGYGGIGMYEYENERKIGAGYSCGERIFLFK